MKLLFKLIIFLTINLTFSNAAQITDSFRFDAYGNINALSSTIEQDRLKLSGGFQGRYQINDNISITGQMHIKEGINNVKRYSNSLEDYDTELKWLYVDYAFENDITLRLGAFQFPVFKASETGDIEYTYTWTSAPLRSYGVFGADDFQGLEVLKNFSSENFDFLAQLSLGESTTRLNDGRRNSLKGDVNSLVGLTLKTSHESFLLNIGYLKASAKIRQVSIPNQNVRMIPRVDFNMIAVESEIYMDDFTLKSGLIKSNLTNIFPEDLNYYSSLEYNYKDITPYVLYSKEKIYLKNKNIGTLPKIGNSYHEKYSIGARYDYSNNIALKFSYTHQVSNVFKFNSSKDKFNSNTFLGTINFVF